MFGGFSEASFVFSSVCEFVKAWDSGSDSKLILESRNGHVQMSFNCDLGKPNDQHFDPAKLFKKTKSKQTKPKPKSQKKRERDNLRAKLYQQKLSSQTKDSEPESEAAPATSTSAEASTEPGDNTENEETSEDESGDDTISLSTSELDNIIETSDNTNEVAAEAVSDYLPLTQVRALTWAESADKTAVTRETEVLRSEWHVAIDADGKQTITIGEHPCWHHSNEWKWCSSDCASPLKRRHLNDQKKCDCGGITAADVMSKDGWQYDHGYCGRATCLRGDKLWMCWRARLTVALDEG